MKDQARDHQIYFDVGFSFIIESDYFFVFEYVKSMYINIIFKFIDNYFILDAQGIIV